MSLAGDGAVVIWHDIAPEGREDFYAWHTHEHMPERVAIPGFTRGRRYIAEQGGPEFFTLYEAVSVKTLAGRDYLDRLNNPTPWTRRAAGYFQNVARSVQQVCHSTGPGIGGHLLTLQLETDDPDALCAVLTASVLTPLASVHGITGIHLCQTDMAASIVDTAEKSVREGGTDVPGWTLMIEGISAGVLQSARGAYFADTILSACGVSGDPVVALYALEYVRGKTAFS